MMLRVVAVYVAAGLLVPLIFRVAWHFLNQSKNLDVHIVAQRLMLVLYPTSIVTLPSSPEPGVETGLFFISLVANVILYAILGVFSWLGLRKHAAFFVPPSVFLIVTWWWLLTR